MKRIGGALLWSVLTTLVGTAWVLMLVAGAVIRQGGAQEPREGLEYETLLRAVDRLLALDGERSLLRFERVEARVGRTRVEYDTLIVTDRAAEVPSLREGGFLHDEVNRYNAFQRDRIALAVTEPAAFERLAPFNPSIFRPQRRADGSLAVGRTAAAWNRRVESPFVDEWTGEVRAADARVGRGLYNGRTALSFALPQRVGTRVAGRSQTCEFEPRGGDALAFCMSEARMPQAIFREADDVGGRHRVVAGWAPLRVDGRRLRPGDSIAIQTGSVVQLQPLEPVVFGEYWQGVLSSPQWINGRMRRRATASPPLDFVSALGRRPVDPADPPASGADLLLSVDARATAELTDELRRFTARLRVPVEFATVVLARVPDGAIVAIAETGTRSEPGRSRLLERLAVGSAVKPLLAAAILSQRPDLASLEVPARSGAVRSVLGAPPVRPNQAFSSTLNCPRPSSGRVDLEYFLRCSNNEYAAALLLASLQDDATPLFAGANRSVVARPTLVRSAIADGMADLFDLAADPVITDELRRSRRVWRAVRFTDGSAVRVPYDVLPDESRPALLGAADDEGTSLSLLYRYAFGAWENRWNVFDLTNGFGRVTSDRRMQLTFAGSPDGEIPVDEPPLGLGSHAWYPHYLAGLRGVARDGTARGLARRWRSDGLPPTVFAKTGTLTEREPGASSGIFIKSLLFSVGEAEGGGEGPLRCGIVGSVYLSFSEGPSRGSLPSYQVEFAEDRLGAYLSEHWERFGACPEPEVEAAGG